VFIRFGASTPFIVRRVTASTGEELHELVGEAYVQGIMMGGAIGKGAREVTLASR